jgi:hypothetical protein
MIVMSLNFSTVTRLKASAEWRFMFLVTEASILFRSTSNTSLMMSSTAGYPPVGNVNGENVQELKLMDEEL